MVRDIKITEFYYTRNSRFKEIMYDDDGFDERMYAKRMNFIHYIMRVFNSRNYLKDIEIEEYKGIPWNYDIKYTNAEDSNDIYTLKFEISDNILPFQKHDPFRIARKSSKFHNWWMYLLNVNKIWCYTYEQAQNVIEVLTGITDKPWHYEE